jgi:hypothetical protein
MDCPSLICIWLPYPGNLPLLMQSACNKYLVAWCGNCLRIACPFHLVTDNHSIPANCPSLALGCPTTLSKNGWGIACFLHLVAWPLYPFNGNCLGTSCWLPDHSLPSRNCLGIAFLFAWPLYLPSGNCLGIACPVHLVSWPLYLPSGNCLGIAYPIPVHMVAWPLYLSTGNCLGTAYPLCTRLPDHSISLLGTVWVLPVPCTWLPYPVHMVAWPCIPCTLSP